MGRNPGQRPVLPAGKPRRSIKRRVRAGVTQFAALGRHLSPPSVSSVPAHPAAGSQFLPAGTGQAGRMASNYVDTAAEEGRFHGHGHHHSTTPTGAAASPKNMRRSWSSVSSSSHGHGHGAPKCVCAPATHAGSFKCRLHRTSSHGGHPPSPPSPATSAAPPPAVPTSSSRTVAAQ